MNDGIGLFPYMTETAAQAGIDYGMLCSDVTCKTHFAAGLETTCLILYHTQSY